MIEQLSLFNSSSASTSSFSEPYTVSQLTGHIRRLFEDDPQLVSLWVEGEVSNFTRASSGHCYFTLKDAGAQIRGVMWRTVAQRQRPLPREGDLVLAHGSVGVYEPRGLYQLYVDQIQPAGVGDLYRQFELLKARLEAEGLFAPERKRSLVPFPRRIGVVTSPAAAALRDIFNVLNRRYPLAEVLLSPTQVQGDAAPPQIVDALEALNALEGAEGVDVIIVARGGGSLEDLWPFNDERVARAIAASRVPVICGVGHETDFSLADFAADQRAPTPSAAAELAVPDRAVLRAQVIGLRSALVTAVTDELEIRRRLLTENERTLKRLSPGAQVVQARQRVDDLLNRAASAVHHRLALHREQVHGLERQLVGVSPLQTLERGYAIVRRRENGAIIYSVEQLAPGQALDVQVADGTFDVEVARPADRHTG